MEAHHIILIVCLALIVLNAANVISIVKKAHKAGKEFNDNKLRLQIQGQKMRKIKRHHY